MRRRAAVIGLCVAASLGSVPAALSMGTGVGEQTSTSRFACATWSTPDGLEHVEVCAGIHEYAQRGTVVRTDGSIGDEEWRSGERGIDIGRWRCTERDADRHTSGCQGEYHSTRQASAEEAQIDPQSGFARIVTTIDGCRVDVTIAATAEGQQWSGIGAGVAYRYSGRSWTGTATGTVCDWGDLATGTGQGTIGTWADRSIATMHDGD